MLQSPLERHQIPMISLQTNVPRIYQRRCGVAVKTKNFLRWPRGSKDSSRLYRDSDLTLYLSNQADVIETMVPKTIARRRSSTRVPASIELRRLSIMGLTCSKTTGFVNDYNEFQEDFDNLASCRLARICISKAAYDTAQTAEGTERSQPVLSQLSRGASRA